MAQLDLWQAELDALPWQGRRPRDLTRGARALFLRREPQKDDRFFVDPDQLEIWVRGGNALRFVYRGAPLLQEVGHGES